MKGRLARWEIKQFAAGLLFRERRRLAGERRRFSVKRLLRDDGAAIF